MTATEYADYARDRTGWFFGMSGPALGLVLVAALPALAAVNGRRWLVLALWLPVWALLVVMATVPVRGRSATGWALALVLHQLGGAMGWTSWQSRAAAGTAGDPGEVDLPGVLAGIQIHDGPPLGHTLTRVAVVQNHSARTWAAVARIVHPGIGLAEPGARNRMGAGLAELQEIASGTELIDLLAIQVRTVPDDGAERAAWTSAHRRAGAPVLARQVNDLLAAIVFSRWLVLIRGLVGSQRICDQQVPFTPRDELAVAAALRTLTGTAAVVTESPRTDYRLAVLKADWNSPTTRSCNFSRVTGRDAPPSSRYQLPLESRPQTTPTSPVCAFALATAAPGAEVSKKPSRIAATWTPGTLSAVRFANS
jgi:hypothetical protein